MDRGEIMKRLELLTYLTNLEEIINALPDGAEIIDIMPGVQIQLYGNFDFYEFADRFGASVSCVRLGVNAVLSTTILGCEIVKAVSPTDPYFPQRCEE